jgi:DNA polymerase/3'-5' exonuclease PolX
LLSVIILHLYAMDNYQIADAFALLAKIMDIHGENSFKTKTYANAAFQIEKLPMQLADMDAASIAAQKGIGAATAQKIAELLQTGSLSILNEYIAKTPAGVIEMLNIKGLGPKKINTVWKEMGIETIGELEYACNENRLTLYKGFGEKTQHHSLLPQSTRLVFVSASRRNSAAVFAIATNTVANSQHGYHRKFAQANGNGRQH